MLWGNRQRGKGFWEKGSGRKGEGGGVQGRGKGKYTSRDGWVLKRVERLQVDGVRGKGEKFYRVGKRGSG